MTSLPNPFVGPRAYHRDEILYGRDREIRQLHALLLSERIVLVHSPSGAGKTSLIQAGLIPTLVEDDFAVLDKIRVNLDPPRLVTGAPNRYLLSVLLSLEESFPKEKRLPLDELASFSLDAYLTLRGQGEDQPSSLVLVFDQFEEILTISPADFEGKQAFFNELGQALRNRSRWALFAIREDYLGALAPYTRPIPNRLSCTYRLELLDMDDACQAIQVPAHRAGIDFSDAAAKKLVKDLATIKVQGADGSLKDQEGMYIEPVQLQVVCYRLWEAQPDGKAQIDEGDLSHVGDVDQSLAEYYSQTVAQAAADSGIREQEIRDWFDRNLITPKGIRGHVLINANDSGGLDNQVIRMLENAHIVRAEKYGGTAWFELAHDRLIGPIRSSNAGWLKQNLKPFQQRARLWAAQDRAEGLLLRGGELAQANHDARGLGTLTSEEMLFLKESQKARARATIIGWLICIIVIAAIAAMIEMVIARGYASDAESAKTDALNQKSTAEALVVLLQEQAQQTRAGELAALSGAWRERNFSTSLLLAIEAFRFTPNIQTRGALMDGAQTNPQLRNYLNRHGSWVNSVAFSPDGKILASGSADNQVILWDPATRLPIGEPLRGHTRGILSVAFSPDGKLLASGSEDKTIILWDVATRKMVGHPLVGHADAVRSVAFSPDGKTLASGGYDLKVRLWDVASQQAIGEPLSGHTKRVTSVAFRPDGKILASGSDDSTIILWDVASRRSLGEPLKGHTSYVEGLVFSPDGKTLISGGWDSKIIFWDVARRQMIGEPLSANSKGIYGIALSPDGITLASGSSDTTITLWNVYSRKPIGELLKGHSNGVLSVAFSPDNKTLASGGMDNNVMFWDEFIRQPVGRVFEGHTRRVTTVAYSPDGKILASGSDDNTVILWDVEKQQPIGQPLKGHTTYVESVAFSKDGKTLASASFDSTIILWDVASQQALGEPFKGQKSGIYSVAFNRESTILASGSDDGKITLWDVASRQPVGHPLSGHTGKVYSVAFSPDGKTLASASEDRKIILWDVASQQPIGQPLQKHSDEVYSVAFNPDGTILASGSKDMTIILWDIASRQPIGSPLIGHFKGIWGVAFSKDGMTLASGSEDHTLILWDVASQKTIGQPIKGHTDTVRSVAFSPDGKTLASASYDTTLVLWDIDAQSMITNACLRAGRNFTREEWRQFFPGEAYRVTCSNNPAGQ